MITLVGDDHEFQETAGRDQLLDPLNFLTGDIRNDDLDLRISILSDDDFLHAARD